MRPSYYEQYGPLDPIGRELERIITRTFYGDAPRCEVCGERNSECRYRPAYQMMLCPECPKSPKPTTEKDHGPARQ